jgi:hypothetical protein
MTPRTVQIMDGMPLESTYSYVAYSSDSTTPSTPGICSTSNIINSWGVVGVSMDSLVSTRILIVVLNCLQSVH